MSNLVDVAPQPVMENQRGDDSKDYMQSLARGLEVIRTFKSDSRNLSVSEVAERTGLSRAAARRCLLTLVKEGYALTDGRTFSLGPKVLELGYAYLSSMDLPERARPIMEEVARRTGFSCSIAVLDRADVVYIARILSNSVVSVGLAVGSRLPAYATSLGRVLLAGLPSQQLDDYFRAAEFKRLTANTTTDEQALRRVLDQVRSVHWALVDEELAGGLRTLAVPILNRSGQVTAALNVCSHSVQTTAQQILVDCLPILNAAAKEIAAFQR